MGLIIESMQTVVGNLIVFSLIPFIWWLIRYRKEQSFFKWIGFIKPELRSKWWALVIFAVLYVFFYKFDFTMFINKETLDYIKESSAVAANKYTGLGFAAIIPGILSNFIANGVAEEIFFRGFLCKRLCGKFGTVQGVVMQAALFGLMHNLLYVLAGMQIGLWAHFLMFIFTSAGSLLLAFLNEKIFNGSILPSILVHGAGNFWGTIKAAFML